ncbi:MAG TPA: ComEA family DNA-binding protein [Anaerolineales bacterium]|nr:ComEA family DNA-binding protein [Anaerolineales bacterium]
MKSWWNIALGTLIGLLAGGVIFLATRPARGHPITLLPTTTPKPCFVHVTGAVQNPGVYEFASGSRIQDALTAAVALPQADIQALNLAAFLSDGQQLVIPEVKPTPSRPVLPVSGHSAEPTSSGILTPQGLININTAPADTLELLSGIGPVMAARIVAYRAEIGGFKTIEEIMDVSGIGPATFEKLKDQITVED